MQIRLLILFCLFTTLSQAAEYEAVVHVASYHPTSKSYNEVNPGLGVRANFKAFFVEAGAYKNSLSKVSKYAGAGWRVVGDSDIGVNLLAGVITGYPIDPSPFLLPEITIRTKNLNVRLVYIPEVKTKWFRTDSALGLSLAVPL